MKENTEHSQEYVDFICASDRVVEEINTHSKCNLSMEKPLDIAGWTDICLQFRESELKFKRIFELNPFPVCLVSGSGYFIEVNQPCVDLWGYSKAELVNGMRWQDLTTGIDLVLDEEKVQELKEDTDDKIIKQEIFKEYQTKSGEMVLCYLQYVAIRDPKGDVVYFISLIISEGIIKGYLDKFKKLRKERKHGVFN